MRKIFTFLFAALMSAGMWADPNIVTPTIFGDLSFTESTTVTMTCPSPDADIYYTTDGVTDPRCDCAAAPEYKQPITITETTIIKAAAYDGNDWSAVAEVTFTKVPAPTTYTLQLVADPIKGSVAVTNLLGSDIIDNGNGNYTVPENAEVTILATPLEGFEFTGWKVGNIDEMVGCYYCGTAVNTEDNPYTFTMTADVAYLAEFAAEDNQQLFDLRYESKLLRVTPNELGVHYFVFIEDKEYYDNRYQQYDQPTMQDYLDYVVGVVVSMGTKSRFVYNGDLNLNPDPIYHTWYDNDHMIVNHDYVAFVFKFENDARVGDVEYLAFTYAGEPQGIDSTPADVKTVKLIRNGMLLIVRDGKLFNITGAQVK